MEEEKRGKVAVAITVNVVIFVFVLVAIVIIQIVQINILNRRKQQLLNEYEVLQQELDEKQDILERVETDKKYYEWFLSYVDIYGEQDPLNIMPKKQLYLDYKELEGELAEGETFVEKINSDEDFKEWYSAYLQIYDGQDPYGLFS